MTSQSGIGFVGLGVMGEPMALNLVKKSGRRVFVHDLDPAPLARLRAAGAEAAGSLADLAAESDVVFLCLPSGRHVEAVCRGEGGLLAHARAGLAVVDCGTSPVALARALAAEFTARGADFADSPIARTRQAAIDGTLSVMVGASEEVYARLAPLIGCFASDITHCGGVGAGQVVKIMNNMVLVETVNALAEALAIGRRSGVDPAVLFATLAKGSADSFALRNHGMKAILPDEFPERAFSAGYAAKDLAYALELAREAGVNARGAWLASTVLAEAIAAGHGARYWPVIAKVVDGT